MSRFESVPLAAIEVGPRFRAFSRANAEKLAVSYTDYGRTAPIIVRPRPENPDAFCLVAGLHRLEGARMAGFVYIEAEIRDLDEQEALRVEIAENTFRFEMTALDRMRSFAELARLYEAEHPKNPGGGSPEHRGQDGHGAFADRFSKDAQKIVRISERSIRRDVGIANALSPEVVELLTDTATANSQAELQRLSRLDPAEQLEVASEIGAGRAGNVRTARQTLGLESPRERDPQEAIVNKIVGLLARSNGRTRRSVIAFMRLKGWLDEAPNGEA